jgi:hypothetical protein
MPHSTHLTCLCCRPLFTLVAIGDTDFTDLGRMKCSVEEID